MARQGGRVQLVQSDMSCALNMAKMAYGGFSGTTIEELHDLTTNPQAEVSKETKQGVECSVRR